MMNKKTKNSTSWGGVADWYHEMLSSGDTYQGKVILPNLARILELKKGERVLDAACGEGFFTRALAESGAEIVGVDISSELINMAKKLSPKKAFFTAPMEDMSFAKNESFDKAFSVLSLQNIEHVSQAVGEVARVLKQGGEFVVVLNHPCFRVPKRSSWGFSAGGRSSSGGEEKIQYRRLDAYLSESKEKIEMHPGKNARGEEAQTTYSFHRPLQVYSKILANKGFSITRIEEWNSHKESQKGPRSEAENRARKEFPLFLCLVARK